MKMDGILLVDKPDGMTSHDVVDVARKVLGIRKIGHAGTLDPFATGLLILGVGRATRLLEYLTEGDKVYEAEITLGHATTTYDITGEKAEPYDTPSWTEDDIAQIKDQFLGEYNHLPPKFSAKKVNGKPAYKHMRKGDDVELKPVTVYIHEFSIDPIDQTRWNIRVACSKGTYVRTLAHDIGLKLGCGAHLSKLRRVESVPFKVGKAITLDEEPSKEAWLQALMPMAKTPLPFTDVPLSSPEVIQVARGQGLYKKSEIEEPRTVALRDTDGRLVATAKQTRTLLKPLKVFR